MYMKHCSAYSVHLKVFTVYLSVYRVQNKVNRFNTVSSVNTAPLGILNFLTRPLCIFLVGEKCTVYTVLIKSIHCIIVECSLRYCTVFIVLL